MARRKGFSDLEHNIENIKKACTNKQVVKLYQYTSKKGISQEQYDVLPISYDKNFEFFRGYIVNIDGYKATRSKNKLSRFYFERLNGKVSTFKKEIIFEKDLINAIKNYQNKSPEQIDSFGWFTGIGNNINTVDLIYGDVFEKYIIKNRKDMYKTKKEYLEKRETIKKPISKKFKLKLTITFLNVQDLLVLLIGHLNYVKIKCDPKDKSRLINEINGYLQSNLTFS
jgi:hypothetical protein